MHLVGYNVMLPAVNTDSEVDGWDTKSVEMTQSYIRINEPLSVYSPWVQRDGPPDAW